MIFENPNPITGDLKGWMLFTVAHRSDVLRVTQEQVGRILGLDSPDGWFRRHKCQSIQVQVVHAPEILYTCCGMCFERIYFHGEGFRGKDIHYAMTRLRKKIPFQYAYRG